MDEIEQARLRQLNHYVPDWHTYMSLLYIGANEYRFHFETDLATRCSHVDVIEIAAEAVKWLQTKPWINRVFLADVRDLDQVLESTDFYGTVLWSHGPETVPIQDAARVIAYLEEIASLVVLMCPWETQAGTGNVAILNERFFIERGYAVNCLGNRQARNSNLLAWKYVD